MESIIRDVDKIESKERRVYEAALGRALGDNQQVLVRVIHIEKQPDESVRGKARDDFHALCTEGTENRLRQGVSVEEADQAIEEAIRAIRSPKTE
jgi:hypothetical protein